MILAEKQKLMNLQTQISVKFDKCVEIFRTVLSKFIPSYNRDNYYV